jgi:nucleotide-binding universal stress UspA family protein
MTAMQHIVVTTDFGEASMEALQYARAEARTRGGTHPIAYPLLASGEPAREILACAERIPADIIIMGTHGRTQVGRFLLGSVTHEVLEHTVRPVLVTHRS